jgi:MFS transporter, PPP family, 3-phenylpropionic acid transporter
MGRLYATLGVFYASFFGSVGVFLPFFGLWFRAQGLDEATIGWVLGAGLVGRVVAPLAVGRRLDQATNSRTLAGGIAAVTLGAHVGLVCVDTVPWLIGFSMVGSGAMASLLIVAETPILRDVRFRGLRYGRARLVGSMGFIAAASLVGQALDSFGVRVVPITYLGLLGLAGLAATAGTSVSPGKVQRVDLPGRGLRSLGRDVVMLILASAAIRASHGVYYAFGTLAWQDAGHSSDTIGLLWAEGVVVEVFVLALGHRMTARWAPTTLLMVGALGAMLRWAMDASSASIEILVMSQSLHGLSFALAHLGVMEGLRCRAPGRLAGQTLGLHTVTGELGLACVTALSGLLFQAYGLRCFLLGSVLSLGSIGLAWYARHLTSPIKPDREGEPRWRRPPTEPSHS